MTNKEWSLPPLPELPELPLASINGNNKVGNTRNQKIQLYEHTEIVDGSPEQYEKVRKAIYDLLDAFNVNWNDPNYSDTPDRVARAYLDYWASGYTKDVTQEAKVFPNESGFEDLIIVKDMKFYSMCSHHLAPFSGYAAIAYVPNKEKYIGLSKLGRILEVYARRFQLQERITAQVADALVDLLDPLGVMVVLYNVEHGCMSSRGILMHEANTTTSAVRGYFEKDAKDSAALRKEALSLMELR